MNTILYNLSKCIPNKIYLQLKYYMHFHKFIDFRNPKTFNEKINWLKLKNRRPEYTQMVDKYAVRKYIAEQLGDEYLIPLLGVWDDPHEIDFDKFPNQFVLKWNHDSGSVVICKDKTKLNITETVAMLASKKSHNGYWYGREWPYKNVARKVIAEQFMQSDAGGLTDYKVHCFNGEPKLILVCKDRFTQTGLTEDFFDPQWEHLDIQRATHPNASDNIAKPEELPEMLALSKKLSENIPFLRVDFYIIEHKIYFSELTFFPASGFEKFVPEQRDRLLGSWINLTESGKANNQAIRS